jgi:carbamoyl-phosphate synthase large subunit
VEDAIRSREVVLVVNSPLDEQSQHDDLHVRRAAIMNGVPYTTTLAGAAAATAGIEASLRTPLSVKALQDYHDRRD